MTNKVWFGFVASLKFDCLVQTGVVAIVNNQMLSLDKCCMKICCTDRCCMDKCCTERCCMDKCCMDKCCMVIWSLYFVVLTQCVPYPLWSVPFVLTNMGSKSTIPAVGSGLVWSGGWITWE